YVIYTSGSTGRPKGVMNQHDGVVNRLLWARDAYAVTEADRVLQKTPFSFDVSVWEFFLPLLAGAQLVVARPDGHRDPDYLARIMRQAGVTMLHFVPSMLAIFLEQAAGAPAFPALRRVLCSGEALPFALQERFGHLLPTTELHNLYGPTEAAVDVTAWQCDGRLHPGKVPIGRPIANIRIHILDAAMQPLPVGAVGEIHIGGIGVARGYLHRPELTEERFVADPFNSGGRLYKTGDLGRWLPDGAIEYLGRNDFQVKIRGFRIELGEIEARLEGLPGVRQAVVLARADAEGDKRLVAYVTGAGLAPQALRTQLAEHLPDYMVPAAIVCMDTFPLSPNGKLERKLLPEPGQAEGTAAVHVAPRTATEEMVASVWKDVLRTGRAGVHDDFFASGGHSLQAARLMFQVNSRFEGVSVSLLDFYRAPTIEALAALIDAGARAQEGLLQPLLRSRHADALTLVCCPYAGAAALVYQPLADALGRMTEDVSVFAVALPGNEVGTASDELPTIEAIAEACVQELLATVSGPLALYGHCVGSNLALEITRRLELAGREVRVLCVAGAFPATSDEKEFLEQDFWATMSDTQIHRLIQSWGGSADAVDDEMLHFMIGNFKKDSRMAAMYELARGDWKVGTPICAIFGSADQLTPDYANQYRRWHGIADTVLLRTIEDGHHYFVGDRADEVAAILQEVLEVRTAEV
ncbi:MAG TPA: amino acid adenylation domain-containing protein, partial [Telluria sp.]|nr:amino acid adenylation domain-containing protein [Telluria sp.]